MQDYYFEGASGKLHYVSYSEHPDKPLLLFLIGMGCHVHYWDEVATTFTANYAVYSLDWRGHGDSDYTPSYTFADYLDDLTRWINQLEPNGREVIIIGHSLGGYIGLLYATQPQHQVTKLVFCDVKTSTTLEEQEAAKRAAARPQPTFASIEDVAARLKAVMPDGSASAAKYLELARFGSKQNADSTFSLKYDRKVLNLDPVEPYSFASKANLPVLVINGSKSILMNYAQAHQLAAAIPNARHLEIADAGHHVFLDKPSQFILALGLD